MASSFRYRPFCTNCLPDYEVVLVVEVVVVDDDVLVVGPPALPAEAASPIPNPAKPRAPIIIVVLMSQVCAMRTPAGFPGANADESASAFVVQSAGDIAKRMGVFMSIPKETNRLNAIKQRVPATQTA